MALDPDGWKAGVRDESEYRELLGYLADNRSSAYRASELVGVISGPFGSAIERERCKVYLETLVELGKVQKRVQEGSNRAYYRIHPSIVERYATDGAAPNAADGSAETGTEASTGPEEE